MMVLLPVWYDNSTSNTSSINEEIMISLMQLYLTYARIDYIKLEKSMNEFSNVNKKSTQYDKLAQELRNQLNARAKDFVPKMYEALKNEGYDPGQAKEKIERDWLNVWSKKWINEFLPDECKDIEKRHKSRDVEVTSSYEDKKVLVEVENTGTQEPSIPTTPPPIPVPSTPTVPTPNITTLDLSNHMLWSKLITARNNGYPVAYIHSIDNKVIDIKSKR